MFSYKKAIADKPIEEYLSKMTLEEKIGQMTQVTLESVSKKPHSSLTRLELDESALRTALLDYHVGSIINVFATAMTTEDWRETINKIQEIARVEARLGIPVIYGIDAVHGANYTSDATLYPQNLNLGATWNRTLVRDIAGETARDLKRSQIPWNFAPVLDLGRHPMWSRFSETFGEDSYLTAELGKANILGQQQADTPVAACAKHFLGYGQSHTGRDRTPVLLPNRVIRELYLPPFSEAVNAGVASIMVNSGELNGRPVHADHSLLTRLLRDELGFDGVIVSDWEDVEKLHTIHRVAESKKEATYQAIQAGIDMSMTPFTFEFASLLKELVLEGRISESRVDDSVRRILKLKWNVGLLGTENERQSVDHSTRVLSSFRQHDQKDLSLEGARQSMVLLKNRNGLLPIKSNATIKLDGPAATSLPMIHGSWSYTWQGTDVSAYPEGIDTIQSVFSTRFNLEPDKLWPDKEAAADTLSVLDKPIVLDTPIVLCIGEEPSVEKPGDISNLQLDAAQQSLVEAALATNRPVVLVLFAGRPRVLGSLADRVAAVIWAGQPGPFAGAALADVLDGTISPSGKLPFTYPKHAAIFQTYDHKWSDRVGADYGLGQTYSMNGFDPEWEFGSGLSYANVRYHQLNVSPTDEGFSVSITVHSDSTR
ncbi:glycoside hydrolase family 3 C-terminal domain-containing protein, partial [bacterium]|nr:glycoside hydrolase family 3 C-terminal domain-containing protein [bacterium]